MENGAEQDWFPVAKEKQSRLNNRKEPDIMKRWLENLDGLLADLRELTENNNHGEALEKIANFVSDRQLEKAFASVNQLHSVFGYLASGLPDIRDELKAMLFDRIRLHYGEETAQAIEACL